MSDVYGFGGMTPAASDRTRTLFGQTMEFVALTAGFVALGAYLGRNLSPGAGLLLLVAFGLFIGLALAPTLVSYANADPQALWEAGGATALFIAGFGAAGYATRRDLAVIGRISFVALIALIVFGIVLIFIHIPHG